MKKKLLSIVLLSLAISSFGQIIITNDDIAPVGTTIYMANDTLPSDEIVPGDAGADKSWDFSSVVAHTVDTMDLVQPASTPYADQFPASNFAFTHFSDEDTTSLFDYMSRSDDKLSNLGYVVETPDGTFTWDIEPENIILDFPVTYQDAYNENYTVEAVFVSPQAGADSVRLINTVTKQTHVDAWGTLTIPLGTYDVLRQREDEISTDSIFVLIGGNWMFISATKDSTTFYSWWTDDVSLGFELFDINVDKSTGEISGVSFLEGSTVGMADYALKEAKAYPNPFSDELNIEFEEAQSGELTLYNQLGQIQLSQKLDHQKVVRFNLSHFPEGMYHYQLRNEAGEIVSNGKLVKR
jgi:hypothetical protein